jgi:hypothetical protein
MIQTQTGSDTADQINIPRKKLPVGTGFISRGCDEAGAVGARAASVLDSGWKYTFSGMAAFLS